MRLWQPVAALTGCPRTGREGTGRKETGEEVHGRNWMGLLDDVQQRSSATKMICVKRGDDKEGLSGRNREGRERGNVIRFAFYRAMHYSAKRGLPIACRPSVCLSVCDITGL